MTANHYRELFANKVLIVDDNYYHLDDKGNYLLAKGEASVKGTYRFRQSGNQVYFISDPPIYPDQEKEVPVTLTLGTRIVLFLNK